MEEKKSKAGKDKAISCNWRKKLEGREEMLKYLETGERYRCSDDLTGSEKKKAG